MGLFDIDIMEKSPCLADSYKIVRCSEVEPHEGYNVFNLNFSDLQHHLIKLYNELDEHHQEKLRETMYDLAIGVPYQKYVNFATICLYTNPDELSERLTQCLSPQRIKEGSFVEASIQYNYEDTIYTKLTIKVISVYSRNIEFILEPI